MADVTTLNLADGSVTTRAYTAEETSSKAAMQVVIDANATQDAIEALEAQITNRRQREAQADDAGGTAAGRQWMADISAQIATLRGQL